MENARAEIHVGCFSEIREAGWFSRAGGGYVMKRGIVPWAVDFAAAVSSTYLAWVGFSAAMDLPDTLAGLRADRSTIAMCLTTIGGVGFVTALMNRGFPWAALSLSAIALGSAGFWFPRVTLSLRTVIEACELVGWAAVP